MDKTPLAELLARRLFECGDEGGSAVQRIAFKGGRYPNDERDQGGMCEAAVVALFRTVIDDAAPFEIK